MRRQLRQALWALPIVLIGLVLLLWLRSYLPDDMFVRSHRGRVVIFFAASFESRHFDRSVESYSSTPGELNRCRRIAFARNQPVHEIIGFESIGIAPDADQICALLIPYWFIVLMMCAATVWWWVVYHSRRDRRLPGHCRGCGYDLRGSQGQCPECGTPTAPQVLDR
jgi:hypothetical protein